MADVYVKGKKIGEVADYLCECPEDAIWCRDLSSIFFMGVKAGLLAKSKEDIEVKNIKEDW